MNFEQYLNTESIEYWIRKWHSVYKVDSLSEYFILYDRIESLIVNIDEWMENIHIMEFLENDVCLDDWEIEYSIDAWLLSSSDDLLLRC